MLDCTSLDNLCLLWLNRAQTSCTYYKAPKAEDACIAALQPCKCAHPYSTGGDEPIKQLMLS